MSNGHNHDNRHADESEVFKRKSLNSQKNRKKMAPKLAEEQEENGQDIAMGLVRRGNISGGRMLVHGLSRHDLTAAPVISSRRNRGPQGADERRKRR